MTYGHLENQQKKKLHSIVLDQFPIRIKSFQPCKQFSFNLVFASNLKKKEITQDNLMDAIVGESYVSRTHTDRNNTALDEGGSGDKNTRKHTKTTSRRQPETTYGVSVKLIKHLQNRFVI